MTAWILFLVAVLPDAGAWPGFLGAGASPLSAEAFPLEWSPEKNIAWKADLPGHGQSSPVIWGDKVFVTAVEGPMKDTCHVLCLSLADGQIRWKHSVASSDPVKSSVYVSRAAPTPVVDAQGVYVYFESGDVVALDHAGQPRWRRSLSNEFGKPRNKFGLAASPVQTPESLIVLVDDEGPSYLIALRKADGATLWKQDRTSRVSWSSPSIVTVGGRPIVVCSSAGSVDGYAADTGEKLWSFDDVGGNSSSTPLPFADGRFLVGASAGREGQNAEGARKSNMAMSIESADGKWTPRVLWRNEQVSPTFGSPIVYRQCAYWVNRAGVVFCLDAATGKTHYSQRIKQSIWATPLGVGDRIYFFGKDGLTTVLAAGPEYKLLAENQLWDPESIKPDAGAADREDTEERRRSAAMFSGPVQYGVAATDGRLLIRTGQRLYCIRRP